MKIQLKVTIKINDRMSLKEARQEAAHKVYVAVAMLGKTDQPSDLFYKLDYKDVKVTQIRKP